MFSLAGKTQVSITFMFILGRDTALGDIWPLVIRGAVRAAKQGPAVLWMTHADCLCVLQQKHYRSHRRQDFHIKEVPAFIQTWENKWSSRNIYVTGAERGFCSPLRHLFRRGAPRSWHVSWSVLLADNWAILLQDTGKRDMCETCLNPSSFIKKVGLIEHRCLYPPPAHLSDMLWSGVSCRNSLWW